MIDLYSTILTEYPELSDVRLFDEFIILKNDSDGSGDYVAKWEYSKPIPESIAEFLR
jgi:hypothetical protein